MKFSCADRLTFSSPQNSIYVLSIVRGARELIDHKLPGNICFDSKREKFSVQELNLINFNAFGAVI